MPSKQMIMQSIRAIQSGLRKWFLLYLPVMAAGLCSGCREKVVTLPGSSNDAQISFFCASTLLMQSGGYVLIDYTDTTFPPPSPSQLALNDSVPSFSAISRYMYPTTVYNRTLPVPWVFYMHLKPGKHSFTLLDGGTQFRAVDESLLSANIPASIFYTDSMGYFRSVVLEDQYTIQNSQVSLRLVDLSPDAGKVFFTISGQQASAMGFAPTYSYGKNSGFVNLPNPVSDTLQINFYQAGDSVDVVASNFLPVNPGHAYTFTLQGYFNPNPTYTDPLTGYPETPAGGLSIGEYQNR
jgi:hypothetical protein